MIPELGHFALILAFLISLVQGVVPLVGAHRNRAALIAVARILGKLLKRDVDYYD